MRSVSSYRQFATLSHQPHQVWSHTFRCCTTLVSSSPSAPADAVSPSSSPSASRPSPPSSHIRAVNQVGRLLRRLPLGRTQHTFFFNELPHPVKMEVLAELHALKKQQRMQERQSHGKWTEDPAGEASNPSATRDALAPIVDASEGAVESAAVMELCAPRLGLQRSHSLQLHYNAAWKATTRLAGAEGEGTGAGEVSAVVQQALHALDPDAQLGGGSSSSGGIQLLEPCVLSPNTESERTSVRIRAVADPCLGAAPSKKSYSAVMLRTESTAPRVDYTSVPEVYLLTVPQSLLEGDATSESVPSIIGKYVVYDPTSRLFLLARRGSHVTDAAGADEKSVLPEPGVTLSHMFSFDPMKACEAAAAALRRTTGLAEGEHDAASHRYRLFYLFPLFYGRMDATLSDMARVYPTTFASCTAEVTSTTRLFQAGTIAHRLHRAYRLPPDASAPPVTSFSSTKGFVSSLTTLSLWTRLQVRRLTVQRTGAADADEAREGRSSDPQSLPHGSGRASPGGANLWSTQQSPTGGKEGRSAQAARAAAGPAGSEATMGPTTRYLRTVALGLSEARKALAVGGVGAEPEESLVSPSPASSPVGVQYLSSSARAMTGKWTHGRTPLAAYPELEARFRRLFRSGRCRHPMRQPPGARDAVSSARGLRVSVHVVEVRLRSGPLGESEKKQRTPEHADASLGQAIEAVLGVTAGQTQWVVPPVAADVVLSLREGVLLPFLRAPVETGTIAKSQRATTNGDGCSDPRDVMTARARALAKHSPDGRVRVVRGLTELEVLSGWRRAGHHHRFGELRDVMGASTSCTTPWPAALLLGASPCGYRPTSSSSAGREPCGPLLFLWELSFVETVLLPSLRAYAEAHYQITPRNDTTALKDSSGTPHAFYLPAGHGAAPLLPQDWAVAVHHFRLCQALRGRNASRLAQSVPLPPFLSATKDAVSQSARGAADAADAAWESQVCVVPILPFLEWLASDGPWVGCAFSAEDVVAFVSYCAHFPTHFEVLAGDRTTVAFRMA